MAKDPRAGKSTVLCTGSTAGVASVAVQEKQAVGTTGHLLVADELAVHDPWIKPPGSVTPRDFQFATRGKRSLSVDMVDSVDIVDAMNAARDAGVLVADIERDARALEGEDLSKPARAALKRIRAQMSTLQSAVHEMMQELKEVEPFSPETAGQRLVAEMQQADGGAYSGVNLREKWNLTPAVLHRRRKEHRIIYWRDAQHDFHYPRWQFTDTGALLAGIQEILQLFKSSDEWRVMGYFLGPRKQLGDRRPLDLLRAGLVKDAITHAQLHASENTW
jgi:hypothetical protein